MGHTYPSIAYSVVEEGLVCFVADARWFVDLGAVIRCVLEDLGGSDWDGVLGGIGRLGRREEEGEGASGRGVVIGGYQPVVYAGNVEEGLERLLDTFIYSGGFLRSSSPATSSNWG